jgi:hypothetical protein
MSGYMMKNVFVAEKEQICDEIVWFIMVRQMCRAFYDDLKIVINSSQKFFHDEFGMFCDETALSLMWNFVLVSVSPLNTHMCSSDSINFWINSSVDATPLSSWWVYHCRASTCRGSPSCLRAALPAHNRGSGTQQRGYVLYDLPQSFSGSTTGLVPITMPLMVANSPSCCSSLSSYCCLLLLSALIWDATSAPPSSPLKLLTI